MHSDRWMSFQSQELKSWLHSLFMVFRQVVLLVTTQEGNGQCERYNGVTWKTILAALKSRKLPTTHWEAVLLDALHSIRSLVCTSTNCTPHKRMFNHARRSVNGSTIPSWLKPGPIHVKKHVCNKNDPEVEGADLIYANPACAHVLEMGAKLLYLFVILHLALLLMLHTMKLYVIVIYLLCMIAKLHRNHLVVMLYLIAMLLVVLLDLENLS